MNVAQTILAQLGGRKFCAMTGAKDFVGSDDALTFKLPSFAGYCTDGINCVRVRLDASDTYTVSFYRVRGMKVKCVAEVSMIYNDQLCEVFESHTGLRTSL